MCVAYSYSAKRLMEEIPLIFLNRPSNKNTENFQKKKKNKKKQITSSIVLGGEKRQYETHFQYSRM